MSFLNPLILFGLFAASLPILIHLFTRTKSRTIPFSTLDFIKKLQNEQVRRIKLRQILLLILRTLIIILIILAFARPTIDNNTAAAAASNANTSMAIIIDNSISTQRPFKNGTLYEELVQRANVVMNVLRPGDEAFLITTTDTSLALSQRSFHDSQIMQNEATKLTMSYAATNFTAATKRASKRLANSANINKEIYLLSDMQRNGFADDSLYTPQDQQLYLWPVTSDDISNISIIDARLKSTILQRGKLAEAVVNVRNTGDTTVENALLQMFIDERRVAQATLHLAPGEAASQVFRFVLEKSGFYSAQVQLEDDDLLQDNRRHFSFYVPETFNIGLVGDEFDLFYISLAVSAENGDSNFNMQRIPQSRLRTTLFDDYDLLVLSNISSYDRSLAERILEFVDDGGGLFLTIGDKVDIRAYNSILADVLHLPKIVDVIGAADGSQGSLSVGKIDIAHPLFSGVFESEKIEFAKPEFKFAVKVLLNEDSQAIMQYSSGDPFLFERISGNGNILVMTSFLSERITDLSRKTIFAPLMTRILAYGASAQKNSAGLLLVGDEIRYKLHARDVSRDLEIKRPDEKYDQLKPVMTPSGAWIHYSLTNEPGIYELVVDGLVQQAWSVRIDAKEFDLAAIPVRELKKNESVIVLDENINLNESIASLRHGRELWLYFAMAAFILLLIEMLLYREKGEVPVE